MLWSCCPVQASSRGFPDANSSTHSTEASNIIHKIIKNGTVATAIFIILVYAGWALIYIFILGTFRVMMRRTFLESRLYSKVPLAHFFYFNNAKEWIKAAGTLLLMDIYYILWSLTVVGAFIKYFSYILVPYIVAENPNINAKEAITLSRQMMNGHKMECFKLHLSFIGWYVLGTLTAGLTDYLYFRPYQVATLSEYYADLRMAAKEQNITNTDKLNDEFLFRKSDPETLQNEYHYYYEEILALDSTPSIISGVQKFFAENFAIWIGSLSHKREYQDYISKQNQLKTIRLIIDGEIYPKKFNPGYEEKRYKQFSSKTHYMRCYTIWSILALFFTIAFIGWLWEVGLHMVLDGEFVNRGSLHGPWLPIYGVGGISIMIILAKFRSNPPLMFGLGMLVSGIIEFSGSYFLEAKYGIRWWDYTGYFLNLDGRICAEGLIIFTIGGMLVVYIIAPMLDGMLSQIKPKHAIPVILALTITFCADLGYSSEHPNSGKGITSYTAYKTENTSN